MTEPALGCTSPPRSLHRLFWQAGALFSGLAVVAVAALLASTAYLHSVAYDLGMTVESLRLAEEVQAELLVYQHAKTLDVLVGSEAHAREGAEESQQLVHLVEWAIGHASSEEERSLLRALQGSIQEFLSSTAELKPAEPNARAELEVLTSRFDDAFTKAQSVIQLDLDTARAQRRHARIQRVAAITAASIAVGILLILIFLGRSLRRELFVPLERVSEAIRAYPRDRGRRAPEDGAAELQQIASTFNLVASDLQGERENQLRFLGGVAHDLRNPLGALRSALTFVGPDRPVPDEARLHRLLVLARRSADRLDRIVRPDHHLVVKDSEALALRGPRINGHRPAIDVLFRTSARARGGGVIGIVLTGMLDDGVRGLREIRERGGVAVVQEPSDAPYPDLPSNALVGAGADHVVRVADMAPLIMRLLDGSTPEGERSCPGKGSKTAEGTTMPDRKLGPIQDWSSSTESPEGGSPSVRTGHAYDPESLLSEQSVAMEQAIWASLRSAEERLSLARKLEARARAMGDRVAGSRLAQQVAQAEPQAQAIRQLLSAPDGWTRKA
jgi:two-component system chemotaxis response regulator CheB